MKQRHRLVRETIAGVLVVAIILASVTLLWGGRREATVGVDRQRDEEVLERARVRWPPAVPLPPTSNENEPAAPVPPDPAPAESTDVPLKADIRPAPSPEIFQARSAPPSRTVDTGLVFSSQPPSPPEGSDKYRH